MLLSVLDFGGQHIDTGTFQIECPEQIRSNTRRAFQEIAQNTFTTDFTAKNMGYINIEGSNEVLMTGVSGTDFLSYTQKRISFSENGLITYPCSWTSYAYEIAARLTAIQGQRIIGADGTMIASNGDPLGYIRVLGESDPVVQSMTRVDFDNYANSLPEFWQRILPICEFVPYPQRVQGILG